MEDHVLLAEFAKCGKAEALGELVRRYEPLVRASAMRQVADVHLAQDITQAAMMTLMRKAPLIQPTTPLGPWLLRTPHYLATDAIRRESARRRHERVAAIRRSEYADAPRSQSIEPALDQALNSLPEKYRTVLILRYLQGLSHSEIAEELGLSHDATRQRLSRALRLLRNAMDRRGMRIEDLTPAALPVILANDLRDAAKPAAHPLLRFFRLHTLTAAGAVAIVAGGIAATSVIMHRHHTAAAPVPPPQLMNARANSTIP